MKTKYLFLLLATVILAVLSGCAGSNSTKEDTSASSGAKPLNISIFIDLSDRINKPMVPSQMSRDIAIVGYIADYLKKQTLGPQILTSRNNMKVVFYPAPKSENIVALADSLCVDISLKNGVEKRMAIEGMKDKFQHSLEQIYDQTLQMKQWPGCDIWDFFSSKKVDVLCMREGYRNVLFILTDGYLYAEDRLLKNGNEYSYVSSNKLQNTQSSLIVKRGGLVGLEICILEVNPMAASHKDRLHAVLEEWLVAMGVKKENITIAETDLPTNVQPIVTRFLEK